MKNISDLDKANEILARYVPLAKDIIGKDITLERMWPLLKRVGNPQQKLKVIHIAGTSGKTSTAYFIAALLKETGVSAGLTVSPHIDSITERVQVNGEPLPDADFCAYLSEFLALIGDSQPTYFELMIAFVYWVFAKLKLDYAVMETGLGGLQDSTNVADRPDKVCVITDIGFDHMHVLGNTLTSISKQKAGIIQSHNHVFIYNQAPEVMREVRERCEEQHGVLHSFDEADLRQDYKLSVNVLPLFQQRNWLLARAAAEYVADRDHLSNLNNEKDLHSQRITIPGRMDTVKLSDKTLIMDGAHNQQKMHAFVTSFQSKYPGRKAAILMSLKQGKEYPEVIDELLPITSELILTTFNLTQDMQSTAIDPKILAGYCREKGFDKLKIIVDQHEAYEQLMSSPENLCVITGSFYLISQIRSNHKSLHESLPKQG